MRLWILAGVFAGITVAGIAGSQTKTGTTESKTPPVPATTPALPLVSPAANLAIKQMAFLSGKWAGKIDAFPFKMDIAIDGMMEDPGPGIVFKIHATPTSSAKMGIEGEYRSRVNYSEKLSALRAVVVDTAGRGVEMIGKKVPDQPEWQFDSTTDGSPFPFKVRLIPVTTDQIVVNYSTGGRLPLKYEVTFNRVES